MKWKYAPLLLFFMAIIVIPLVVNCIRNNSNNVDYAALNRQLEKELKEKERERIDSGEYVLVDEGDSLYHTSTTCSSMKRMPEVTFRSIVEIGGDKFPCPECSERDDIYVGYQEGDSIYYEDIEKQ